MRTAAIQTIDQRVSDIDLTGSFSIERRSGVPDPSPELIRSR
jgi:hypothetical protein